MKKKLDVLLVARPDQSLSIYHALNKDTNLTYKFIVFKVFPKWVKKIVRLKKMVTLGKNVIICYKLSIINICKYYLQLKCAQNWDETTVLDKKAGKQLSKTDVKIIHYWPEFGNSEILKYKEKHLNVFTIADIHMPYPLIVFQEMIPVYEKYGIDPYKTELYTLSKEHKDLLNGENTILVPSKYVEDTYRRVYPNIKCYTLSYGITRSKYYTKKNGPVKNFVYAGRISLEKGSDLLLEYFANHAEVNLHIYGSIVNDQKHLFQKYTNLKNIIFHGHVPKVELQKELSQYDVGIHLSRFDAYSLAVGEMIGVGLPVIVSDKTGSKDDVEKYGWGVVTSLNYDDIEKNIKQLSDINNYKKYITSIYNYTNDQYLNYGDKVVAFYKDIIKHGE